MAETKKNAKIHYVGKGVYSIPTYIEEAKRLGVSRAFPKRFVKNIEFGQKILLSTWTFTETQKVKDRHGWENIKRFGTAKIFGYFVVEGINLPASIMNQLIPKMEIIDIFDSKDTIVRECGTYVVLAGAYVKDNIEKIMELAEELDEKVKYFITGTFYELDQFEVEDMLFARTLVDFPENEEELPETNGDGTQEDVNLKFIDNYQRFSYKPKTKTEEVKAFEDEWPDGESF